MFVRYPRRPEEEETGVKSWNLNLVLSGKAANTFDCQAIALAHLVFLT